MRKKDQSRSRKDAYRRMWKKGRGNLLRQVIAEIRGCIHNKNLSRANELANIHGLSDEVRRQLGLRPKPRWTYA